MALTVGPVLLQAAAALIVLQITLGAILDPNPPDPHYTGRPPGGGGTTGTTKPYVKPLCSYNGNWLNCSNFHSFSQLNFKNNTWSRQETLIICPLERMPIDDTLDLTGYDLTWSYLKFMNINGFPLVADPARNIAGRDLWLESNELHFEHEKRPLNEQCDAAHLALLGADQGRPALFSRYRTLAFWKGNELREPLCPLLFKDANLSSFSTHNAFTILPFAQMAELNAYFEGLSLYEDDFSFDVRSFDPILFRNVSRIRTYNARVVRIEADFFRHFEHLSYMALEVKNLEDLFVATDGAGWLRGLNHRVNVNISQSPSLSQSQSQSQSVKASRITVTLTDNSNSYLFPDSDFCWFKDFPHSQLVFVQIESKANYECTCTIYWLHMHKRYHSFDYVYNARLKACFADENKFASAVAQCDFSERLKRCDESQDVSTTRRTTTPTTTVATTSTPRTTGLATGATTTKSPAKPEPGDVNNQSSRLIQVICNNCTNVTINLN